MSLTLKSSESRKIMKKIIVGLIITGCLFVVECKEQTKNSINDRVIGIGKMPAVSIDHRDNFHIVYGSCDSILYSSSNDNGESFSAPSLVDVLPELSASAMRGPQIASITNGIVIIACNKSGNIFSYIKDSSGYWSRPVKVNDIDTVAKEQFIALSADGNHAFAAWLDLRGNKRNKIAGA